jgi:hypothetical protein
MASIKMISKLGYTTNADDVTMGRNIMQECTSFPLEGSTNKD